MLEKERIVISDEKAFEMLKGAKILNIYAYDGEYSSEYAEFMVIETDKGVFEVVACGCSLGWSLQPQKN